MTSLVEKWTNEWPENARFMSKLEYLYRKDLRTIATNINNNIKNYKILIAEIDTRRSPVKTLRATETLSSINTEIEKFYVLFLQAKLSSRCEK